MKRCCKILYKLSEVYSLICNIIEYSFVSVALILYVAYFHLQVQCFCYLPAFYHRAVFLCFGLLIFLHVGFSCNSVHTFNIVRRLNTTSFLKLQLHQSACKRNYTYIMSRVCFYGHYVSFAQFNIINIMVISFTSILKLYFNEICCIYVFRNILQPIICVQLLV